MNKTTIRAVLRYLARKGGQATARKMTAQQRTERARKGGLASVAARQAKARQAAQP